MDMLGSIKSLASTISKKAYTHLPKVLTAIGAAGVASTTVFAVKDTIIATKLIEQEKEERGVDDIPVDEIIKTCWKCYLRTGVSFVATETAIIAACVTGERRRAALSLACQIVETANEEYRKASQENLTKPKREEIEQKEAQEAVNRASGSYTDSGVQCTRYGNQLFYDSLSNTWFRTSPSRVDYSFDRFNGKIEKYGCADLTDLYEYLEVYLGADVKTDMGTWSIIPYLIENITVTGELCYRKAVASNPVTDESCWVLMYDRPPLKDENLKFQR